MIGNNKYRLGKKILLFLLLFAGINGALSFWYYKKVVPKNKLYQTDANYKEHIESTNTLFLGHSRAQLGVDEELFQGAINYASYGENNVYTYYKIKRLLEDNRNVIERVFIPCGFGTFSSLKSPHVFDHSYWNQYIDYIELGQEHNELDKYAALLLQSKIFPYSRSLQLGVNKRFKFSGVRKSTLQELTTELEKEKYAYEAIRINFVNRNSYDTISYKYLERTLALCQANNIEVVAIKYPVTSYYFEAYNELISEEKWNTRIFDELLKANNVEVLNFEQIYFKKDELFRDTHHLNEDGKKQFSELLKRTLDSR